MTIPNAEDLRTELAAITCEGCRKRFVLIIGPKGGRTHKLPISHMAPRSCTSKADEILALLSGWPNVQAIPDEYWSTSIGRAGQGKEKRSER